jgi:hypothetical protein
MGFDIRWPIGLLFVTFGVLLAGFGLASDAGLYERSLGVNVNLWWGVVMLAFGTVMLALAARAPKAPSAGGRGAADRSHS